jgi:serine/threonine protein kinase
MKSFIIILNMINSYINNNTDKRYNSAFEKLKPKFNISQMELMGKGGFGSVYEVLIENKRYAIKVIDYFELLENAKSNFVKETYQKMINNECTYLINLNHKNLLKGISRINYTEEKLIIILMVYCENLDLQFIKRLFYLGKLFKNIKIDNSGESRFSNNEEINLNKSIKINECLKFPTETFLRFFASQILNGLKFLHECGLVHCDLKLKNILVTRDFTIKIAGFGTMKSKRECKNIPNIVQKHINRLSFCLD